MENPDEQYKKGFNSGYLLSKHDPDLLDKLLKSPDVNNEYIKGMTMGKKQNDREKLLGQLKESQKRSKGKEKER